ncbi:haloacid dehalogenase [Dictyobacter vulcani]|uniref:Haloacid dehalogenase n=1 Tax=Dictyobacter vulcani TaxID=2607529 RepID=A0A5J4KK81_9CHLR|nr:bis(5'-nucleosyl)-tetraphosphatase (symmetrical) YqeK [Dictyobacter vulcani]GER90148.1 haloacid dehalogenase [Dictyobacter vulcani]
MSVLSYELLGNFLLTGEIAQDMPAFLQRHNHAMTAHHCQQVAAECRQVAASTGVSLVQAEIAGWLHDVSAIFPASERAQIAHALGLEVLAEEERCPMIVHQKLSRLMAQEIFGVTDLLILDAIGCHTTLRAQATLLDKVLFVADKLAWDQPGIPPYDRELRAALAQSLDAATSFFVRYLWDRREALLVIHPWLRAAALERGY